MARTVMPGPSSGSSAPSWRLLPQLIENKGVDPARQHALLVVLDPGPVGEGGVEIVRAMVEPGEPLTHLVGEDPFEWQRGVGIRLAEEDVVQVEQARDLTDRLRVVVDAQVDEDIAAAAVPAVRSDDEQ